MKSNKDADINDWEQQPSQSPTFKLIKINFLDVQLHLLSFAAALENPNKNLQDEFDKLINAAEAAIR